MAFQKEPGAIHWRLHLRAPRNVVFAALATDEGRGRFWAERTEEREGRITFHFMNYPPTTGEILAVEPPALFRVTYFDTVTEFRLDDDGAGGTDLTLHATRVPEAMRQEMIPGWVSVLMAMKAYVDHGIDLRNHDATRSWQDGYCDN